MTDLLVTGAGSLARATLLALSLLSGPITTVAIAARDTDRLHWLARAVRARGALDVTSHVVYWDDPRSLADLVTRTRPRVVLHTASRQSAWTLGGDDPWSAVVRTVGYGATLPLQAVLAHRLGRALVEHSPSARFVNACFPDAVNPVLANRGIPVACGIGNVAILAALAAVELGATSLVAHHAHIAAAIAERRPSVPLAAWRGDARIDAEATAWLASARLPGDERLNDITGATAVPLIHSLVDDNCTYRGHAPGPGGLCGGYPIKVTSGAVELDLPSGMSRAEAEAHNRAAAELDGLTVTAGGRIRWSPRAEVPAELRTLFDDEDLEAMARRLHEFKARASR